MKYCVITTCTDLELSCTGRGDEDSLNFNCEANKPISSVSCSFDGGELKPCELVIVGIGIFYSYIYSYMCRYTPCGITI